MVNQTTPLNQAQKIPEIFRGSLITVIGSGGHTEAPLGSGIVTTYFPPAGKSAKCKVSFSVSGMGTNTELNCGVIDLGTGNYAPAVVLSQIGSESFEVVLTSTDERITFRGDNAADDGDAACLVEITEAPQ